MLRPCTIENYDYRDVWAHPDVSATRTARRRRYVGYPFSTGWSLRRLAYLTRYFLQEAPLYRKNAIPLR